MVETGVSEFGSQTGNHPRIFLWSTCVFTDKVTGVSAGSWGGRGGRGEDVGAERNSWINRLREVGRSGVELLEGGHN